MFRPIPADAPAPPIIIVCEKPSQGRMPSRLPDGSQVVLTSAVCHSPLAFAILFLVRSRDIRQIHSHTSDVLFNQSETLFHHHHRSN
ncbi:hypothetical protein CEXT_702231 [Caerostris extrusa]|uniref:Uncharacterized protein n=1 Tax=Caerostris extrusa TaxID=172846 RepID=A0AAV4XT01_CAEEX|nr:hypothetical protein CEXT_702231 [Caerostris extrusa]